MKVYIVFSKVTYKNNYLHEIPNIIEIFANESTANERSADLGDNTYVKEFEVSQ
jgi:hypothetical protein